MGIHGIFDNRRNWICQLGHKSCVRFWDICLLKNFIQIGFVKKLGIIILLMMMKCSLLRREYVCLCGPPGQFIAFARTHLFYWIFRCLLDELFFCDVIFIFCSLFSRIATFPTKFGVVFGILVVRQVQQHFRRAG